MRIKQWFLSDTKSGAENLCFREATMEKTDPKNSVVREPLYVQVHRILTQRIKDGEWGSGEKIPSETDLARQMDVSVGTMRKALGWLVSDGVLVRQAGHGSFVSSFKNAGYRNRFQPFQPIVGRRRFDCTKLIVFENIPADDEIAHKLKIPSGEVVIHIVRHHIKLNKDSENIVCVDETFLNRHYFEGLNQNYFLTHFRSEDSLYKFYDREFGVVISRQKCRMRLSRIDDDKVKEFQLDEPFDTVEVQRTSLILGTIPVEYRINHMKGENLEICFDLS